jgi:hypothetical protein
MRRRANLPLAAIMTRRLWFLVVPGGILHRGVVRDRLRFSIV